MLAGVVDAARDLAALERSLDANLEAIAGTGRFEEALVTLTAAVQLLAARAADAAASHRIERVALRAAA